MIPGMAFFFARIWREPPDVFERRRVVWIEHAGPGS